MNARQCPKCDREVPLDAPEAICPECLFESCVGYAATATFAPGKSSKSGENHQYAPPTLEELADSFPRLEVLDLIGAGGMGYVYRARQKGLDRLVALKILREDRAEQALFAERFEREAMALARLDHPHIVGVYEYGRAGEYWYLVLEYADGVTLRELLSLGRLDPATALGMVPQICDALEYAHRAGVVHRDIKPENILVDTMGNLKIADFGLAKFAANVAPAAALTQPLQVMGTMQYMAPEQMRGAKDVDHRADIYSLGVVIYEMLTGELPIGRFDRPSQHGAIDTRIDDVVLRSLERDPNRRFQRVSHLRSEFDSIAASPMRGPSGSREKPLSGRSNLHPSFPKYSFAACLLILIMSILPWRMAESRSKFDVDQQFVADQELAMNPRSAVSTSIYPRFAGLEWGTVPEGVWATAWQSAIGIRPIGSLREWSMAIPDGLVPATGILIAVLLLYRYTGRVPPTYVILILAIYGMTHVMLIMVVTGHRGTWGYSVLITLISFLWILVDASIVVLFGGMRYERA